MVRMISDGRPQTASKHGPFSACECAPWLSLPNWMYLGRFAFFQSVLMSVCAVASVFFTSESFDSTIKCL